MRKLKIKKGYALIVAPDAKEYLCKNCFFHNRNRKSVNKTAPGCLRSVFMECPSKAHLEGGKNIIYRMIKTRSNNIKEATNA